ncbi:DUF3846 domain-containing protein, partial [Mycobacterium tuberculosis]|uniref:DUF3846 domain-containing protein n=1 Tax=Mycobacterium tuberculosis TaxID=1773 RepID=UPI0015872750
FIVVKKAGQKSTLMKLDDVTLQALQELVGGFVQQIPMLDDIELLADEEGAFNKQRNIVFNSCEVFGTAVACDSVKTEKGTMFAGFKEESKAKT